MDRPISLKRRTFLTLGVSAAGASLASCAPPQPSQPSGGKAGPLQVWGWNQDPAWAESVAAFNSSQSEFTVEYRGIKSDEYNAALQTGLSGSSGPDVMMLRSYGGLETVVASNALKPIADLVPTLTEFAPASVAGATARKDGLVYGVPFAIQTANIIYNMDLFDEVGIKIPSTWDDLMACCESLQSAKKTPFAGGFLASWILPILRDMFGAAAYGGSGFAEELLTGKAKFTDDRYTAANQVLLDLKPHFAGDANGLSISDGQTQLSAKTAAMHPGGIWDLNILRESIPDVRLGVFNPPPVVGSQAYAMGYVDGSWGISARIVDEKMEAASALLNYFASEPYGKAIADDLLQIPCVPGVSPTDEALSQARAWFDQSPTPYLTYVHFDYGTPSGTSLEYDSLQRMMLGKASTAQVGSDLDKGISQWFKPN